MIVLIFTSIFNKNWLSCENLITNSCSVLCLANVSKGPSAKDFVCSLWPCWEVADLSEVGPSWRKRGCWGSALERDIGTTALFSLSLHFLAAMRWAIFFALCSHHDKLCYHRPKAMCLRDIRLQLLKLWINMNLFSFYLRCLYSDGNLTNILQ